MSLTKMKQIVLIRLDYPETVGLVVGQRDESLNTTVRIM